MTDPYGVPAGYVPHHLPLRAHHAADPIQRAVDDFFLMERKARAWDEAVKTAGHEGLTQYDLVRILKDVG